VFIDASGVVQKVVLGPLDPPALAADIGAISTPQPGG